jgi:hypothetical protein
VRDPEFDEKPKRRRVLALRCWQPKFIALVWVALMGLWLLGIPVYSRRPYTCAVCRLDKLEYDLLGLIWFREKETDCSRWYRDHVERSHTHAWIRCTYCRRFGIPGLGGGYGCTIGGPLTGLSRTVQMSIYQHFKDPLDAKRLFIRLGQTDADNQGIWDALMGWIDKDYPGTWDDWCGSQRHGHGDVSIRPPTSTPSRAPWSRKASIVGASTGTPSF